MADQLSPRERELMNLRQERREAIEALDTYKQKHKALLKEIDARIEQIYADMAGIGRPSQRGLLYTVRQGGRIIGHGSNSK